MARYDDQALIIPRVSRGKRLVARGDALVIDAEGIHADDRTIRWMDFGGLTVGRDELTVETGNGRPLHCASDDVALSLDQVVALVELWMAFHRAAAPVSGHQDDAIAATDADWDEAASGQAPDDQWLAFGDRDDENPLHR